VAGRTRAAETSGDVLMVAGGAALLVSLFLTWTHQFPASLRSVPGLNVALRGVSANPSAWQVYSVADVLLALVAVALMLAALRLGRRARLALVAPAAVGLAFVAHAAGNPPTNGLNVVNPRTPARGYVAGRYARAGVGETVAIVGLATAVVGLGLGLASGAE
jgi:hypothetical protein